MNELKPSESHEQRRAFGYTIVGPILADMLRQLHANLHGSSRVQAPIVFFCARGGLVLRRTLELFAHRVGVDPQIQPQDFMISRLTAFRAAFQLDPGAVTPLIEMEFAGRTCAEASRALASVGVDGDKRWCEPFSVARLVRLTESTESGRCVRAVIDEQATLLRRHIDQLRGTNGRVILCDTGVYGSILRYLQVGVPSVDWRLTLLFRSNYKRISAPHFDSTVGVVSESNAYVPWQPCTVALLYWQLIEAMLEPAVPSVRYYSEDAGGRVVSNLEVSGWQNRLDPPPGSILAGACRYLSELTPESIASITERGKAAWRQLRRMIVFPSMEDVALMAVGQRQFDFGMDESVEFTSRLDTVGRSLRERLSFGEASMWPEGELRKRFPRGAGPLLLGSELFRLIQAMKSALSLTKVSRRHLVS